ncbi:MAG: tetratricopeptide repeat protein [Ignavibacteriales bacterium]|jgi:tetratricopeptide (TPR) repeat protein|nr:MAG: tetratricopeptide repeat protein [Ignavibacteriales bacterium]
MNKDLAKIKLIYEFNPSSPLFARVAESELESGNTDTAIQMLERGMELYPDYISAKLVYIQALAKKGEYKKVIDKLDELKPILNDDSTINYYLEKIEEEKSNIQNNEDEITRIKKPLEEDLENLAETINKAKIPPIDSNITPKIDESEPRGKQFVSETLAGIYLAQSSFKEALDIYEKLLESNPAKTEYYERKIEEIKNMMNK